MASSSKVMRTFRIGAKWSAPSTPNGASAAALGSNSSSSSSSGSASGWPAAGTPNAGMFAQRNSSGAEPGSGYGSGSGSGSASGSGPYGSSRGSGSAGSAGDSPYGGSTYSSTGSSSFSSGGRLGGLDARIGGRLLLWGGIATIPSLIVLGAGMFWLNSKINALANKMDDQLVFLHLKQAKLETKLDHIDQILAENSLSASSASTPQSPAQAQPEPEAPPANPVRSATLARSWNTDGPRLV